MNSMVGNGPELTEDEELEIIERLTDCISDCGYLDLSMSDPSGEEETDLNYIYYLLKDREKILKEV